METLLKQLAGIDGEYEAILALPDLNDENRATLSRLDAKRTQLEERIDLAKKQAGRNAQRAQLQSDADKARVEEERARRTSGRLTSSDIPGATHIQASGVEVAKLEAVPLPEGNRGFKSHREFLLSVMDAGRGVAFDNRLRPLLAVGSDEARNISDPAGGFLTPEGFSPSVLQIDPWGDPMGGLTTKIPMQFPTIRMPCRVDKNHSTSVSGGLTVTRRPETVAGTPSQMTFERVVMEAHELFGLSYTTEEILTDSPQSFIAILQAGFSDQFTYHLINERLNGTGIGEFMGIMNSPCLVSVAKETGQVAATIVKENIDKMRARCWRYGRAVWMANHDCLPQLKSLAQIVGVGGAPVPYLGIDSDGNATLDGRPLIITEYCKTVGTQGDLVLGVWSEYLEGTYQPLMSAESIHVRFVNHERAFKFWLRNAGQPWWKSALTPKNSSNTLSPFVVLDTRS